MTNKETQQIPEIKSDKRDCLISTAKHYADMYPNDKYNIALLLGDLSLSDNEALEAIKSLYK